MVRPLHQLNYLQKSDTKHSGAYMPALPPSSDLRTSFLFNQGC